MVGKNEAKILEAYTSFLLCWFPLSVIVGRGGKGYDLLPGVIDTRIAGRWLPFGDAAGIFSALLSGQCDRPDGANVILRSQSYATARPGAHTSTRRGKT